jgi:hypothetical protein
MDAAAVAKIVIYMFSSIYLAFDKSVLFTPCIIIYAQGFGLYLWRDTIESDHLIPY